ncbi:MAG: ATP-dependent DNA ligase [Peptococcaceae bacterium]|nr:ATP-dependent DNA ligase [Peptococcaceae bacterium]
MNLPLWRPMLACRAEPFDSPDYLFEVKWDGYRCLAYLEKTKTTLRSRNLRDLSPLFPELQKLHDMVVGWPAILDGEIVIMQKGKPSFAALQKRNQSQNAFKIERLSLEMPAVYVVFDILLWRGRPVLWEKIENRKELLAGILRKDAYLCLSEFITGDGTAFFDACAAKGLEGIMAKKLGSPYLPGKRSAYWKKIRTSRSADLVICGYQPGRGRRTLGSLLLCAWDGKGYVYQGRVGTGFTSDMEKELIKLLNQITIKEMPLRFRSPESQNVIWVEPVLVCTVEYTETTEDGLLRHPSFKGFRFDKAPRECTPAASNVCR